MCEGSRLSAVKTSRNFQGSSCAAWGLTSHLYGKGWDSYQCFGLCFLGCQGLIPQWEEGGQPRIGAFGLDLGSSLCESKAVTVFSFNTWWVCIRFFFHGGFCSKQTKQVESHWTGSLTSPISPLALFLAPAIPKTGPWLSFPRTELTSNHCRWVLRNLSHTMSPDLLFGTL